VKIKSSIRLCVYTSNNSTKYSLKDIYVLQQRIKIEKICININKLKQTKSWISYDLIHCAVDSRCFTKTHCILSHSIKKTCRVEMMLKLFTPLVFFCQICDLELSSIIVTVNLSCLLLLKSSCLINESFSDSVNSSFF
jgi:hypothetical protein